MVQRKFDARHEFVASFTDAVLNSLTTNRATIIPIVMNDDAQGDPMDFKAHPEHASWAEQAMPNCYPDSEIKNMRIVIDFIVPAALAAISSAVRIDYGLISCAFPEDLDALDEKSGLTLKEVLEIQKETTDRQTFPLWSAIDMIGASTLHAEVPGLTATQKIEGVNFSLGVLRDQKRYGKIKGLIKKCMPIGLRSLIVRGRTVAGYTKRITINFTPSNAKFINPYTFLGLLISMPPLYTNQTRDPLDAQVINYADITSNTEFIAVSVNVRFDERNPEFHMGKV